MLIRVFNADDHPMMSKAIKDLILQTEDLKWVGSAADGQEALNKIRSIQPDIALLDIEMPKMTGLEVATELHNEKASTKIILFTLFKDEVFIRKSLEIGVKGYLLKDSSQQEILNCIDAVYKGESYVTPSLASLLVNPSREAKWKENLTKHEINILKLIAQEKTSNEIAGMLFLSPKTIANHRNNISKKLELSGVQNGLLKWAMSHKKELS